MALVGEHDGVVRQIFEQGRRRHAGPAAGEIARVVLDAGAGAGRLHHLDIEARALLEPLRLDEPRPARVNSSSRPRNSSLIALIDCSSVGRGVT